MHFTPTGSSWINQVERWFGLLTDQLLRRGVHKSVAALENDVRDWITTWNDNPKPFRWTKPADEILDSLAKYMARTSGAGSLALVIYVACPPSRRMQSGLGCRCGVSRSARGATCCLDFTAYSAN